MPAEKSGPADAAPKRRRIALWKKLVFAAIACAVFFATAELALWATGVPTLIEQEDPFRGFSGLVTVFERDGGVYRTRRAALKNTFNDQSFLAQKPANGLRIFCLGGSSSFGFPWGADSAFTAILGEALAANHPERRVEAVNASGVSYAMHRLNIVADELLAYQPDVFVIYSGHNEFIEPAFFEALKHRASAHTRIEYVMAHSRVYSAVRAVLGSGREAKRAPDGDFDAVVRRDEAQVVSSREKEEIVAEYRWRLERLIRVAQAAGVKVVVSTIPCNLREWRPEASAALAALSEENRQAWSEVFGAGQRHLEAKEWGTAKANLERAARLAPGHARTQFLLGQAYEALKQWDDARLAYQRACDADASPVRRVSGINDAIREVGRQPGVLLVDADRVFEELSEHGLVGFNLIEDYVHPTQKGHEIIAWHLWDAMERAGWLGSKAPAKRAVFDDVIAERRSRPKTKNATWFYNQGVVLANQGRSKEAIQKFREALEVSPNYVMAMANLGGLLVQTGKAGEAVAPLEQALEIDPDNAVAHSNLGTALNILKRFEGALIHYREALRLNPKHSAALVNLGLTLQSLGRFKEAVTHYEETLKLNPDSALAHNNLANVLLQLGRLKEAAAHYEEALRLKPGLAKVHENLADTLLRLGRAKEAMAHYKEALRLKPGVAEVHSALANLLLRLGRAAEAVEHYEKALKLKPDLPQDHHNLGYALVRLRRPKEAIAHYEEALRLRPDYVSTRNDLALALQRLGRFREAAAHLNKALQLKPDYALAVSSLAWLLATCPDASVRDGRRAVTLARRLSETTGHKDPVVLNALAAACAETGNYEEAVRSQEKAVLLAPDRMKNVFRRYLELYKAGKPYHMPTPQPGSK